MARALTRLAPVTATPETPVPGTPVPATAGPVTDGPPRLAVIGGGQLARMMAQAAVGLGVEIRLLAEGPDVSAAQVVRDTLVGRLSATGELDIDELGLTFEELDLIDRVYVIACGTSYHAGLVAKNLIEAWMPSVADVIAAVKRTLYV